MKSVTLYYKEGSSDKVYQASIEPRDGLFAVQFAYGRRGSTLNTGTKTSQPVSLDEAESIFAKLVAEKQAKGYTEGPEGTPYTGSTTEKQASGLLPQLLNPIEESEATRLIQDPHWCLQEKLDGRRLLIRSQGAAIDGINRKGLVIGLPEPVFQAARLFEGNCVLDGESIGDVFHVFDLLLLDGQDIRSWAYRDRLVGLMNLLGSVQQHAIRYVETAYTTDQKQRRLQRLKAAGREGVVFKRLDASYTPGRPNSGGTQLKHKFCATLSAVVSRQNPQRSVELRLLNGEGWIPVGNVTIPVNELTPAVGQVVEIKYLYAFPESGCLYQPVYLGLRHDVERHDCVLSQLKFKPEEEG
jgi:bifunctional non-homologous end joining protein LigD